MMPKVFYFILLCLPAFVQSGLAGLATYGFCQSGCNASWVGCYAALGLIAGTTTAGVGAPAVVVACNAQQGLCMAACAAMVLSPL